MTKPPTAAAVAAPPSATASVDPPATTDRVYDLPTDTDASHRRRSYFLIKSEPNTRIEKGIDMKFSLTDLIESDNQTAEWDGVRNYQARNILKAMKCGDLCFFYHSNCKPPGIVGVVEVVTEAYPDHTQFDPKNPHYDGSSKKDDPRWIMVDVKYVRSLKRMISLDELKTYRSTNLSKMDLFTKARLSCQRVSPEEWCFLHELEEQELPREEDHDKHDDDSSSDSGHNLLTEDSKKGIGAKKEGPASSGGRNENRRGKSNDKRGTASKRAAVASNGTNRTRNQTGKAESTLEKKQRRETAPMTSGKKRKRTAATAAATGEEGSEGATE